MTHHVSDNAVLLTMIIGSFLIVTMCLVLAVVVHCFNNKEIKGFNKWKFGPSKSSRYRIRRSFQSTGLTFRKDETSFFTNRDEIEWDHIDVPIDARIPSNSKPSRAQSKYGAASNRIFEKQAHYNSYHSVLADQWTEV